MGIKPRKGTTMSDVRTMKPVGTKAQTTQEQMAPGYLAQGFAVAQIIIAASVNTAQQLRRAVESAFDLEPKARDEIITTLNKWKKDLAEQAKANGNLRKGGMDDKALGRIARSATVRTSEFTTIVKAMNNGMSRDTLRQHAGVKDVENIGFHTIVEVARQFNQTGAQGGGRPADPFEVKLAKWLARQQPTTKHDKEVMHEVTEKLAGVLPAPTDDKPY